MPSNDGTPRSKEFDKLFEYLTDVPADEARVGKDGSLFIPPSVTLNDKPRALLRIKILAGPRALMKNIVNGKHFGWWIKRPPPS
ncbi:MAG: hypothetical protein COZ49_02940 [Candidatus Yonathbacteria bacterium CG_4_10_14_3_um_filter_47_65]|uniref:Uncharacterized protein n=1 Tax=Candidatus Yonathbacteria bacterium CG_4_9_14_0_8_um_filter_46_47 TaxID=1975106 RepID=A0A2M8D6L2_9BACT|nr:MAG: hypothetical protein COX54_02735 [Candidatus Yonathbacteria bacterium CG23_combo_of_CG06-09_8_20_14_all_46_18]PIQ31719.1 MAG: hypothetical protein COW61_03290 [Candidatus Yonathbacteria bacterium CG17_big_fil_post_rev_8_21_14_2_50_46_19]PIX56283.1 MAG: hypothetical protein COZ49_02940 [Candidatus Yonathbacteria bacterium CG_4_10_14_3_um_filter_47_65]PIY57945.1 MAG: hypothetical protein COY99_00575 [Candidatus Yonathbacteria bacterium CG_4_10_14_0_8_um_filter_47_645]PJB82611.1 MAG: hypot